MTKNNIKGFYKNKYDFLTKIVVDEESLYA